MNVIRGLPKIKQFKTKGERLPVQVQRGWLILTSYVEHMTGRLPGSRGKADAKHPATLTYGDLARAMGYDPRAGHTLGGVLGIIGNFCIANGLPPLNAIVVNQHTGAPGAEVVLRTGRTWKQEQAAVMDQEWFRLRVPTSGTFRRVMEATRS